MKRTLLPLVCASAMALAFYTVAAAQAPRLQFPQSSPTATLKQRVGVTDIEITYSRPGAKGREVFGGAQAVVPYGELWRTGANQATKVTFSTHLKFGGVDVPAGTYALFSIPERNAWTVILSKGAEQWGAFTYNQANDVARIKVTPVRQSPAVETFTIDVNDIRDDSATLNLTWQEVRVPVKLQTDLMATLVPQIEAATAADKNPPANLLQRAAMFYLEHDLDLDKAVAWLDRAIAQQPKAFHLVHYKARILAKKGDKTGAIAAARKSIEMAAPESGPMKEEYTRLNEKLLSSLGQ